MSGKGFRSSYSGGAEVGIKVDIITKVYFKGLLGLSFTCLLVR